MESLITPRYNDDRILAAPARLVDHLPSKLHRLRPFSILLGSGHFGKVFLVRDPTDRKQYALKCIPIPNGRRAQVVHEVDILLKLEHVNIVKIHGAWPDTIEDKGYYDHFVCKGDDTSSSITTTTMSSQTSSESFRDEIFSRNQYSNKEIMFIKMEFCEGGTLQDYLDNRSSVVMTTVQIIFTQLLTVLEYLKKSSIVHNDIRPANVLFQDGLLKLADFGLGALRGDDLDGNRLDFSMENVKGLIKTRCSPYKSPETVFFGHTASTNKSDLYSVGVIMFRLLCTNQDKGNVWDLFDSEKVVELMTKLRGKWEEDFVNLVEKMVAFSPIDRPEVGSELFAKFIPRGIQDREDGNEMELCFVTRSEWGARPPKVPLDPLPLPVGMVIIIHSSRGEGYCSDDSACEGVMREIQDLHMDSNKWDDIGYQ